MPVSVQSEKLIQELIQLKKGGCVIRYCLQDRWLCENTTSVPSGIQYSVSYVGSGLRRMLALSFGGHQSRLRRQRETAYWAHSQPRQSRQRKQPRSWRTAAGMRQPTCIILALSHRCSWHPSALLCKYASGQRAVQRPQSRECASAIGHSTSCRVGAHHRTNGGRCSTLR